MAILGGISSAPQRTVSTRPARASGVRSLVNRARAGVSEGPEERASSIIGSGKLWTVSGTWYLIPRQRSSDPEENPVDQLIAPQQHDHRGGGKEDTEWDERHLDRRRAGGELGLVRHSSTPHQRERIDDEQEHHGAEARAEKHGGDRLAAAKGRADECPHG